MISKQNLPILEQQCHRPQVQRVEKGVEEAVQRGAGKGREEGAGTCGN